MKTPKYESELHVDGGKDDRKHINLPCEIYDNFIALAGELGFGHKGKIAVVPLLDAISQIEPEELESILRDRDLMPKRSFDSLW